MRFLIIGLGIYGTNLAMDLAADGHEVIGADVKPALVDNIKNYISTAYILDCTDATALNVLPLKIVDLVIVAIGENFGASIKAVALLKQAGVKHIYARATDRLHEAILQGLNVERIITPEQQAAFILAQELALGSDADVMKVADNDYVMQFKAPEYFVGRRYSELNMPADHHLTLIAATRGTPTRNVIGVTSNKLKLIDIQNDAELTVQQGDVFTCFGPASAYRALRHLRE